jgi:hypothetical protein
LASGKKEAFRGFARNRVTKIKNIKTGKFEIL